MLKKFLILVPFVLLAYSYSPSPAKTSPFRPDTAVQSLAANTVLVRRRWRALRHREPQQTGIPVFIIPGLYWGPAWWDPAYVKQCWKKPVCRDCANYWFYVC